MDYVQDITPSGGTSIRNMVEVNIKAIMFYSMALMIALGFNSLAQGIFSKLSKSQDLVAQTIYVVVLFTLTIILTVVFGREYKIFS